MENTNKIMKAPESKGENDRYGLVLGGGGSKGCYHVGVWTAFNEQGIYFDAISGTSIGALVGIFYPGNHIEPVTDFVMDMEPTNIAQDLPLMPQTLKQTIRGGRTILNFVIRYKDTRMDIRPLREHFRSMFDYETFKNSPVRFACMSYNDTKKEARPFYKGEITADNAEDIIMASSACYPAFPKVVIDGDEYMDGMYADNVPIQLLQSILPEAAWTVVVDLHDPGEPVPPALTQEMFYIQPLLQPGNPLDFSTHHAERLYAQGYLETMKYLGRYPGHLYTFRMEDKPLMDIVEDYIGAQLTQMKVVLPKSANLVHTLYRGVLGYIPPEMPNDLQENYYFGQMVEALALMARVDPFALYDYKTFLEQIMANLDSTSITKLNPEEFALVNLFKAISKEELPLQLYRMLKANGGRFSERVESLKERIPVSYTLAVLHYILQLLSDQLSPSQPEGSDTIEAEKTALADDDHPAADQSGSTDEAERLDQSSALSAASQKNESDSLARTAVKIPDEADQKTGGASVPASADLIPAVQPDSINSAASRPLSSQERTVGLKKAASQARENQAQIEQAAKAGTLPVQNQNRIMPPLPAARPKKQEEQFLPARLPKYKETSLPPLPARAEPSSSSQATQTNTDQKNGQEQ